MGASRVSTKYCFPASRRIPQRSLSSLRMKSKSRSVIETTPSSFRFGRPYAARDFVGDQRQRHYFVGKPRLGDITGHAPDHGSLFVLHENLAAGLPNRFAAMKAVLPHACE